MASQDRTPDPSLIESLVMEGSRYSFFQALYILEQYFGETGKGDSRSVVDERAIRLTPSTSLGFPASDIVNIEKIKEGDKTSFIINTSFLGLYGSSSPLPSFYSEDILWNDKSDIKIFLDLFHHRLLSLFYKSWCKYRFHIQFREGGTDKFSKMMLALSGLNLTNFEKKDSPLSPIGLLRFSGLLTQRPKSASALRNILRSFFSGATVHIKEFIGKWSNIISEQRNSLGKTNTQLGVDLSLGARVFNRTGSFRVVVCPETYKGYLKFLPGEEYSNQLTELTNLFSPSNLEFDVELKFPVEQVAQIPLRSDKKIRLGYTSWLGNLHGENSIIFSHPERTAQ